MKRIQQTTTCHHRAGTYLLEMLIVIGVSSILVGVMTLTLHQMLLSNSQIRDRASDTLAQHRLARLFREDCEAAASAEMDGRKLVLKRLDNKTVTYEPNENIVTRTWTDNEASGSDRFYSTRKWNSSITLADSIGKLTVAQAFGGSKRTLPGTKRQIVIEARIGRNQLLAQALKLDDSTKSDEENEQ